jgi:histone H3/H4
MDYTRSISKARFEALVRDIIDELLQNSSQSEHRLAPDALAALQFAGEHMLVSLFGDVALLVAHRKAVEGKPEDVALAARLRQNAGDKSLEGWKPVRELEQERQQDLEERMGLEAALDAEEQACKVGDSGLLTAPQEAACSGA